MCLTWTLVVESYLNDLVCPFSKKTLRTLAMGGTQISPKENADGCTKWKKKKEKKCCECNRMKNYINYKIMGKTLYLDIAEKIK